MDGFPDELRQLFDAVIRVACDDTGALKFGVQLIDRYHDGPHVPSTLGNSPLFDSAEAAVSWASKAIDRFVRALDG